MTVGTISVQFSCSIMPNSLQPHGLQHAQPTCPSPSPRVFQVHVPWVGDAIQPSQPLSPSSPSVFNLSQHQGLFQWVSSSHQVAKVLELQLQHQSFYWVFRVDLGPFRMDFPLGGTLKSLLKHHSSKASILWRSAFFMVQLSRPYMTTGGERDDRGWDG